jgi:polyisoprenoid-binding protein YceI
MKIDGDSNVRSWDADVKRVEGTLVLQDAGNFSLGSLTAESFKEMRLRMPVESIDSGNRGLTRNIHSYLKEGEHPDITFTLNRITGIEKQNGSALITAEGVVNAAGKDHPVAMNVTARMNDDGSINFRGEQTLLMTSFDITPPTAVMGTVRARDEFKVIYSVNFK